MDPVTRRRFLTTTGGVLGLSAATATAATMLTAQADASTVGARDFAFTDQSTIVDNYGGVQLSKGSQPAAGRIWQVRRVFWNTAMAHAHMASSLDGWLGCCGNGGLTGNGDMQFDADDLLIRPGQYLWIWFITPSAYSNWVTAAGMSGWDQAA